MLNKHLVWYGPSKNDKMICTNHRKEQSQLKKKVILYIHISLILTIYSEMHFISYLSYKLHRCTLT